MRLKDWEILKVGDCVTRVTYENAGSVAQRSGAVPEEVLNGFAGNAAVRTQRVDFQVVRIEGRRATLVRLLSCEVSPGVRTTQTETVELSQEVAAVEAPLKCVPGALLYAWEWNAPVRGEARLTGGFIVTRADGTTEYDRCPTDTTRR